MSTQNEAVAVVEKAYITLLQLPMGSLRIRSQATLAECRNFLAKQTGQTEQVVQEKYEELVYRAQREYSQG